MHHGNELEVADHLFKSKLLVIITKFKGIFNATLKDVLCRPLANLKGLSMLVVENLGRVCYNHQKDGFICRLEVT